MKSLFSNSLTRNIRSRVINTNNTNNKSLLIPMLAKNNCFHSIDSFKTKGNLKIELYTN